MSEDRTRETLEDAARWFAALRRGVMTVEDRASYQLWVRDSLNYAAIARLERTWSALDLVRNRFPETTQKAAPATWSRLARRTLVATLCAVSLGIGVLSYVDDTGFWTTLNWRDR